MFSNKCPYYNKKLKRDDNWPYCSYHCQERGRLHQNKIYLRELKRKNNKEIQSEQNDAYIGTVAGDDGYKELFKILTKQPKF